MAKRQSSKEQPAGDPPHTLEELGRKLDEIPTIEAAEEAIRKAQDELRWAREQYRKLREQAADEIHELGEGNFAEVWQHLLEVVRKHPGPSVIIAAILGALIGRLRGR